MAKPPSRPVFLNLLRIHFPATALVSLAHRVTGVVLALSIPLLLYLLELSLRDAAGFEQARQLLKGALVRVVLFVALWALLHHLLAGVRLLCIDLGIGLQKAVARNSAVAMAVGALLIAVLFAVLLP